MSKLHIKNIPDGVSGDMLTMFLENNLKVECSSVEFSPSQQEAIAYLTSVLDNAAPLPVIKKLKGQLLDITFAPACAEITGLAAGVSSELLQNYLENKRSGGKPDTIILYQECNTDKAIVGFNDENVRDSVVRQSKKTVDGKQITVKKCEFPWNADDAEVDNEKIEVKDYGDKHHRESHVHETSLIGDNALTHRTSEFEVSESKISDSGDGKLRSFTPSSPGHDMRKIEEKKVIENVKFSPDGEMRKLPPKPPKPIPIIEKQMKPISSMKFKILRDKIEMKMQEIDVTYKHDEIRDGGLVSILVKGTSDNVQKAQIIVYELLNDVKDFRVNIDKKYVDLLQNDLAKQELKKCLLRDGFPCEVTVRDQTLEVVTFPNDEKKTCEYITNLFMEEKLKIDVTTRHVVKKSEWNILKNAKQKNGLLVICEELDLIILYGFKDIVLDEKETLEEYLKGKSVKICNIDIKNLAKFRYIESHMRPEIKKIEEDMCYDEVHITCESGKIRIKGKSTFVDKAENQLMIMEKSIKSDTLSTKKRGMAQVFTDPNMDGCASLHHIENRTNCAIEAEIVGLDTQVYTQRITQNAVDVIVGDITTVKADVLVNSIANQKSQLSECGAIAKAFSEAGGDVMKQEFLARGGLGEGSVVTTTSVGSLPCKMVIHVSIRDWAGKSSARILQQCIEDCLWKCEKEKHQTIAFPTLGCGNMGYPAQEVAACFAAAASMANNVQITIVAFKKDKIYDDINERLTNSASGKKSTVPHSSKPKVAEKPSYMPRRVETLGAARSLSKSKVREKLSFMPRRVKTLGPSRSPASSSISNLEVIVGDITQISAEVLVNSLGTQDKDLNQCGVIAKAFRQKVGQKLQDEFEKTGGLSPGSVATSTLCDNLQCKMIVHLGLEKWTGAQTKQVLLKGIKECLVKANAKNLTSIAFPALGCGNLNVPPAELAQCFLECATAFSHINIKVVSFKNDNIFSEIKQVFTASTSAGATGITKKCSNVKVTVGDITKVKADVLVNSLGKCNKSLDECGVIAKAFKGIIGQPLQDEFEKIATGGLKPGKIAVSKMTNGLNSKLLIHLGLEKWTPSSTKQVLINGIKDCLTTAKSNNMSSIAFPALGCGNLDVPPRELANCFVEVAPSYPDIQIEIVSFKKDQIYSDIESVLQAATATSPIPQGTASSSSNVTPSLHNLSVVVGDITKLSSDILVNSVANDDDDLSKTGAVGNAFSKAGGSTFIQDFKEAGGLKEGQVQEYCANLGKLQCQMVIHVSIRSWNSTKKQVLKKILDECISLAKQNRLKSITMPTLGCGNLKYPVQDVYDCIHHVAVNNPNINITIVAYAKDAIYDKFADLLASHAHSVEILSDEEEEKECEIVEDSNSDEEVAVVEVDTPTVVKPEPHKEKTVCFHIYSKEPRAIADAKSRVSKAIDRYYINEEITDSTVGYLPHLDQRFINDIWKNQSDLLDVDIDIQTNVIRLGGEKEAVKRAVSAIKDILLKASESINPELIRRLYLEDHTAAHSAEYYRYMAKVEPKTPHHWSTYPNLNDEDARRTTFKRSSNTLQYSLKADQTTFDAVEELILKSWEGTSDDSNAKIKVTAVNRIENPIAYLNYMHQLKPLFQDGIQEPFKPITSFSGEEEVHTAKLNIQMLEKMRNPQINEYFLFHGTKANLVNTIVSQGLESRLSGNGYFGRGIYLAEKVSKSHQYTDKDGNNKRNLIILQAPLGHIYRSEKSVQYVRPPCMISGCEKVVGCAHNKFYNSILGKHQNPSAFQKFREFIIYENGLCYPCFHVEYEDV